LSRSLEALAKMDSREEDVLLAAIFLKSKRPLF